MDPNPLHQLLIAVGLGLLVGLQREWADKRMAGARTFPLITVFGTLCALLATRFGGWEVAAGLVVLASMLIVGNVSKIHQGKTNPGLTTELAALVMFGVGALLAVGATEVAVAVGGGVAVLLHWKTPLHEFVDNLSDADVRAVARLVVIGLVILPILPDKSFGPYDVINPFEIWLMVVLIVGISLAAYLAYQILGKKVGTILAGLLGGLISSTATTVSYARRTREVPETAPLAAVVVMIASTVVFARVLLEIAVVAPEMLARTAPPLIAMAVFMAILCVIAFLRVEMRTGDLPEQEPPSNLVSAIVFGLLYAAVLLGVAAAKEHFGDTGLFTVAALSGLTDMDAITLSTAQMSKSGRVDDDTAWRLILVGSLSNLVFKGGAVALLGTRRLLAWVAALFGLSLAGGVAILVFWP